MELGATMELLGEEVSQLWGRRPPFKEGGTIQPLHPKSAPQRAVLPQEAAVLPLGPERTQEEWEWNLRRSGKAQRV